MLDLSKVIHLAGKFLITDFSLISSHSFSKSKQFFLSTGNNGFNKHSFNPLNPNIKIQILICYPYTFSI